MTIRTKIWLIAVSVAVTVGVASWGRMYLTRNRIIKDAETSALELAHDIADDLMSVEADADDRDLEEKLLGYLNRNTRIVRLDLYVYREATTPSSRIAAPRGDRPEITRFAPFARQPIGLTRSSAGSAVEEPIELPVDLPGPWKATLVMKWTLGQVESTLKTWERYSISFSIAFVIVLTALSGFLTQRTIGRPLEALAEAMRDVEEGEVTLAASSVTGVYLLPPIVARFRARYPQIALHITILNSHEIVEAVLDWRIDFGLVEGDTSMLPPELQAQAFARDELVLVVAPGHRWSGLPAIAPGALGDRELLLREQGSGIREVIEHALRLWNVRARPLLELPDNEAIKQMAISGVGAAILSALAVQRELAAGDLIQVSIEGMELRPQLSIVQRIDKHLSRAAQAFCALLQSDA